MSTITELKITGMTCNHCVMHTKKALEAVEGVENAEVTLEPGAAKITGSADVNDLIRAVKDAGYTAETV